MYTTRLAIDYPIRYVFLMADAHIFNLMCCLIFRFFFLVIVSPACLRQINKMNKTKQKEPSFLRLYWKRFHCFGCFCIALFLDTQRREQKVFFVIFESMG